MTGHSGNPLLSSNLSSAGSLMGGGKARHGLFIVDTFVISDYRLSIYAMPAEMPQLVNTRDLVSDGQCDKVLMLFACSKVKLCKSIFQSCHIDSSQIVMLH